MTMRRVYRQHIHARLDQQRRPFDFAGRRANRRPNPQASQRVFGSVRVIDLLLNIFDRNQARQFAVSVHHQHFFNAVLVQNVSRLFHRRTNRHRHQLLVGHQLADALGWVAFKTQVAIGQNTDQIARFGRDWHTRNMIFTHQFPGCADGLVWSQRNWIGDHAAFRAFDAPHLIGLTFGRHIFVDNPKTAFTRQRNRQPVFRYRVHRRRNQRRVDANLAG